MVPEPRKIRDPPHLRDELLAEPRRPSHGAVPAGAYQYQNHRSVLGDVGRRAAAARGGGAVAGYATPARQPGADAGYGDARLAATPFLSQSRASAWLFYLSEGSVLVPQRSPGLQGERQRCLKRMSIRDGVVEHAIFHPVAL